ncbi:MAG TPA: DHHA1 domain-containing protein, partial [Bacteroidia bacterium]|nr:DHHA1 domain-containing protein [Bacteroidia bacterium]
VVMIDHHLHPKKFAGLTFSFPDAAATAELVYHLIKRMNWRTYIGPSEASALYCGIMTDTGSFRFNSMSGDLHQVIADLFTTGFNHTAVHEKIFDSFSESRLRLLGYSITEGMKINWEYRVAIIALSKDILQKYQYKTGDSEGFVNYGLSISGIEIAILLSERENEVRISMRSRVDQDVRSIASEYFNGGGHKNAAGGVSKISLESTIEKIEELLPEFVSKGYLKLL